MKRTTDNKIEDTRPLGSGVLFLKGMDLVLAASALLLLAGGVWFMFTATGALGIRYSGDPLFYAKHQLVYAALGCLVMVLAAAYGRSIMRVIILRDLWWAVIGLFWLVLLAAIFPAGRSASVDMLGFRPAIIAGIALLCFLAHKLGAGKEDAAAAPVASPGTISVVGGTLLLLLLATRMLTISFLLIFAVLVVYRKAGLRWRYLGALAASMALLLSWEVLKSPYRVARVQAAFSPALHPLTTGYQAMVSLKLIGSGGLFGGTSASGLMALPCFHTDYSFAALLARHGGLAGLLFLVLMGVVIWRGIRIAQAAAASGSLPDSLLAWGLTCFLGGQGLLHVLKVFGVFPASGLGMPFLSYGASFLLANSLLVGLLLCISSNNAGGRVGKGICYVRK